MRKLSPSYRGFLCAAAALVLAVPGLPRVQAAARTSNLELLTAQLPAGMTPTTAKMKDLDAAVRTAVAKRPAAAAEIVRLALLAKKPKKAELPCPLVREIVDAAMKGAPDRGREIAEMAQSLDPQCADSINEALNGAGIGTGGRPLQAAVPGSTTEETAAGDGAGNFGAGFGPGFPGSPGFSGSSPSGGFALPSPGATPVTNAVNS